MSITTSITSITEDELKALEIADTIHDMVHPKKGVRRCELEEKNDNSDIIYNLDIVTNVFQSMPKYDTIYKNEEFNITTLKKIKTYSNLSPFFKKDVKDFEDVIVQMYNKKLQLPDKYTTLSDGIKIMKDYSPPGSHLPPNSTILTTIASLWDPILSFDKKDYDFNNNLKNKNEFIKVIGTDYIYMSNTKVKLSNEASSLLEPSNGNNVCELDCNFLSNRRNFKNSVNTLCTFASELKTSNGKKTEIDISVFENLVLKHFFQFKKFFKCRVIFNC